MSDRSRLAFERVEIRRMPGIDAGFAVEGLCPGINVICGPNASGKTSLTRAVAMLLWPRVGAVSRDVLDGTFALDGRSWRVGYDSGSSHCQCDGRDSDFPVLDSADDRERYMLALHDLLRADNRGFAEAILRESTGGYDIGQAISDLEYLAKPSTSTSLKQRLDRARDAERTASRLQDDLREAERRRDELLKDQELARVAGQRVQAIERAREYQRATLARDEADRLLATFPPVVASLSGNELDELQRLRERLADSASEVEQERLAMGRARQRDEATGLPAGLSPGLIATLRSHATELQAHSMDLRSATERRAAAEEAAASARLAIGPDADDQRLAALDAVQFNGLAGLMAQSQQAHEMLDGLTAIASWIPPTPPPTAAQEDERDRLQMGIRYLTRWLRHGHEQPVTAIDARSRSTPLLIAAGLAIVEGLLLSVLAHPTFVVFLFVGVVLLVLGLRNPAPQATSPVPVVATGADWRGEYELLGLESPEHWEPGAVEALLDTLSRRLRSMLAAEESRQHWKYIHDDRPAAVQQAAAIDARVAQVCQRFGIPTVSNVAALHTLANAISVWQVERGRAAAAAALQSEAQVRFDNALRRINSALAPFGYPAAVGYADATSMIDDLDRREKERGDALADLERGARRIDEHLQPQLERCLDELRGYFERFGLEQDDEYGLRALLDRVPDFQDAKLAADRAALQLDQSAAGLDENASFALMDPMDLEDELSVARETYARLDSIVREIATIDARVDQAKRGNDIEAALAAEQAAADALRDARAGSEAQVAGWTLATFVQAQTRDVDRPRVFHRARELFARITQGRYELNFDDADPPRFRATDTVTGIGHALDELSSGTRLQLLLAVRVAFVEQQERGPKLPLILDETLGNSDEHRARAIIDATVQIARDGRQVLYLTAQHDEVRKWQSIMADKADVPFSLVDLAQIRGLADWDRLPPASPQPWPMPVVPEPNGHNREEYGRLLHVPGIDLNAADTGGLHLWHLIDDSLTLHGLLSLQIETWGQLRTLAEHGGISTINVTPDNLTRCRARAGVIATIAESWRVGRGRPVDRVVLRDSDAVTPVFIDRVSELAESLNGNAVALIDALEEGQITRFHTSSRMRLQEFLEEHGYIDRTPPLSLDDVRVRVLAGAAPDLAAGLLTPEWVNSMLATLWGREHAVGAVCVPLS